MTTFNTLIIYDWDDTLFPTSWIMQNSINIRLINDIQKYKLYFNELDNILYSLLYKSILIGKVMIITNAIKEWILISKKILPKTSSLIDEKIEIISARDMFNKKCSIEDWKKNVFQKNIIDYVKWSKQIISIGDAMYEYNAMVSLNNIIKKETYLKIIKLMSNPSFDDLIDQLEVINKAFNSISQTRQPLDLKFDKMFEN
jgi:hypothetical protein